MQQCQTIKKIVWENSWQVFFLKRPLLLGLVVVPLFPLLSYGFIVLRCVIQDV